MNENAPREASNLNNPCPRIRAFIGNYPSSYTHLKEDFYNGLSPVVLATQWAASDQMRMVNGCPTQSYDFLADDYPRVSARKRPPTTSAWNNPNPGDSAHNGNQSIEYATMGAIKWMHRGMKLTT